MLGKLTKLLYHYAFLFILDASVGIRVKVYIFESEYDLN